ncbi:MAG TPA: hypothetical protein VHW68_04485 [Actinomycetota bacterium]|nr:hypothetical protein [Actinomycetota bacterium]
MKTLTRPPQTPVRPRAVADAPRRWPRRLAAIATVVVLIVAAIAAVWLSNIEPLATGPVTYSITEHGLHVERRDVDALGVTGTVQSLPMIRGMVFRYRFSITNTGRLPITIVDAGFPQSQGISTHAVQASPSLVQNPGAGSGFGPFAPFRLSPGDVAGLTMEVTVPRDACSAPGSFTSWYQEPVTYRVLGVVRNATVETGTEIRLEGTDATAC